MAILMIHAAIYLSFHLLSATTTASVSFLQTHRGGTVPVNWYVDHTCDNKTAPEVIKPQSVHSKTYIWFCIFSICWIKMDWQFKCNFQYFDTPTFEGVPYFCFEYASTLENVDHGPYTYPNRFKVTWIK